MIRVLAQPRRWAATAALIATPAIFGAPFVQSVTLSPNPITSGQGGSGTVVINGAHSTPITVTLASSNPTLATVPSSVTVPASSSTTSSAGFSFTTAQLTGGCSVIKASVPGGSDNTMLMVNPAPHRGDQLSLSLSATTIAGGSAVNGKLTLIEPLGTGPLLVRLHSDNQFVTVPPSVTLPAGTPNEMGIAVASVTFRITTAIVGVSQCAVISATQSSTNQVAALLRIVTISG
jgi:trimeric autotransporter adhesin